MLGDSSYMTFWKRQTMETVKKSVFSRGSGKGRGNEQVKHRELFYSEIILCDAEIVETCHYT